MTRSSSATAVRGGPVPTEPLDPAAAISIRGLGKRYGEFAAVDGLDLDIRRGEIFALLGPNGAGKTTTVEICEGYRRRDAGEVRVLGEDPADGARRWKAQLGIVLQSGAGDSQLTCRELLQAQASYYADPRDPAELLSVVGLTEQAHQRVDRLSGGQRRRLDVALALVGRPELLFLDEPTTGFDPEARRDFHALIARLAGDEGVTVLLTTHDLAEAERLADRIAMLVNGRIRACGTPAELARRAAARAEVRWTAPDGTARRERTADPSGLVWELHREAGGPIADLEVRRPTLEDTYLHMVHRDDTDGAGEAK